MQFGYPLAEREGDFGVFDKAVSSWFDDVSDEHGLTKDGKTVAAIIGAYWPISTSSQAEQPSDLQVVSSGQPRSPVNYSTILATGRLFPNRRKSLNVQTTFLSESTSTSCGLFSPP